MKSRNFVVGIGFVILGGLLSAGTKWIFPTCGPMESGAWMKCHWSGQVTIGIGIVIAVLGIVYAAAADPAIRAGLSLSVIPVALLDIAVLNGLIGLCGNAEMQCRAVTKPAATIISAGIIVLGAVNAVWLLRNKRRRTAPQA